MVAIAGKTGTVIWDAADADDELLNIQSWTCDISVDAEETTAMGSGWKSRVAGFFDWNAQVVCKMDTSGIQVPLTTGGAEALGENTPAQLELWIDETALQLQVVYGPAMCTKVSISEPANGSVDITYDFVGQGEIAWDDEVPTYA